jgi:NAD(P)H-flavin reductase
MMRLGARALVDRGVRPDRVAVSLERNMRCGIALCGHCQLGPLMVCRDGPVVGFDIAEPLFATREL